MATELSRYCLGLAPTGHRGLGSSLSLSEPRFLTYKMGIIMPRMVQQICGSVSYKVPAFRWTAD